MMHWKAGAGRGGLYLALVGLVGFSAFPFFWMVSSSLKPFDELLAGQPNLIPSTISWRFYQNVLQNTPFVTFLTNTAIVTLSATAIAVVVASLAGYGLARSRFRAKRLIGRGVLLGYMLPQILLVVPLFVAIVWLRLADSYLGLTLTYVTFAFPFATWLLTAYYQTIPVELEEAARIDGASNAGAFFRITLPLALPGIATAAIFSFILSWNEFLYSFVIMNSENKKTLAVGLYNFIGGEFSRWGELLSASTMMVVPVVFFVLLVQRHIVSGLSAGALKG
jgi:ABC-type glycerol-3-phosphate transport system permease component